MGFLKEKEKNEMTTYQDWLDKSLINLRRMSQDESYRQEVASRATNWTKNPTKEEIEQLEIKQKIRNGYQEQNEQIIRNLQESLKALN